MRTLGSIIASLIIGTALACTNEQYFKEVFPKLPTQWIDLEGDCLQAMREQIQMEVDACFTYLALGALFSRDQINRPGFAELFFKAAGEERDHAAKLIEYLSMRGKLTERTTTLIKVPRVKGLETDLNGGAKALTLALQLETNVTRSIRQLIATCDRQNYYHIVDYLTGVYLEEQLYGQRELAGKLMTLKKMMQQNGELGEFLFDKNLLEGIRIGSNGGSHF